MQKKRGRRRKTHFGKRKPRPAQTIDPGPTVPAAAAAAAAAAPHHQLLRGACLYGPFDGKTGCLKLIVDDYGYLKYDIWVFVRL